MLKDGRWSPRGTARNLCSRPVPYENIEIRNVWNYSRGLDPVRRPTRCRPDRVSRLFESSLGGRIEICFRRTWSSKLTSRLKCSNPPEYVFGFVVRYSLSVIYSRVFTLSLVSPILNRYRVPSTDGRFRLNWHGNADVRPTKRERMLRTPRD